MRSFCAEWKAEGGGQSDAAALTPSPGTPGEGGGEGDLEYQCSWCSKSPSPLPSPRVRGEGVRPELFRSETTTKIRTGELLFLPFLGILDRGECPVSGM
jgi:hypothetical protein